MTSNTTRPIEHIVFSYQGEQAEAGRIPLDHLLVSLGGWKRFIELCAASLAQKQLSPYAVEQAYLPQICVQAPREGTVEIFADVLVPLGITVLGAVTGMQIHQRIQEHRDWRRKVFKTYIRAKKSTETFRESAEALERLAAQTQVEVDKSESANFLLELDDSMKRVAKPIEHSVVAVELQDENRNGMIRLARGEKQAIQSGFMPSGDEKEYAKATINSFVSTLKQEME